MVAVVRKPIADGGISQGEPDSEIERGALKYAIENRTRIAREIVNTSVYYREEIPFTMFMAGSPGAGKTEISLQMIDFCEKEFSSLLNLESSLKILRIDPDEIRASIPGYVGSKAHLYQRAVSKIVEKVVDRAFEKSVSFLLDGTLSSLVVADRNIQRAVARRRHVDVFYVYQDPISAWKIVQNREVDSGRAVPFDVYIKQLMSARDNVEEMLRRYGNRVNLGIFISKEDSYESKFMATLDDFDRLVPRYYDEDDLRQVILAGGLNEPQNEGPGGR